MEHQEQRTQARVLFVGESNTSRSVLAGSSLKDCLHCESKVWAWPCLLFSHACAQAAKH